MPAASEAELQQRIRRQRWQLLRRLQRGLEKPMLVLAFVWLALFVVEMVRGLSPLGRDLGYVVWALFGVDFLVGYTVAPGKWTYLRANWLSALALAAPALRLAGIARVLRLSRLAGAARGARLLRAISSINRGMRALGKSMRRRGFGYVATLTLLVTLAGAAGMYGLEPAGEGVRGFDSYGSALWWTAMIMTTMGSEYWPHTAAGRLLCFFLSLYALGVLGYIAATLATFFVGRDAARPDAEVAGRGELQALRRELAALRARLGESRSGRGPEA